MSPVRHEPAITLVKLILRSLYLEDIIGNNNIFIQGRITELHANADDVGHRARHTPHVHRAELNDFCATQ